MRRVVLLAFLGLAACATQYQEWGSPAACLVSR